MLKCREFTAVGGHEAQWVVSEDFPMGLCERRLVTKVAKPREAAFYLWLKVASEIDHHRLSKFTNDAAKEQTTPQPTLESHQLLQLYRDACNDPTKANDTQFDDCANTDTSSVESLMSDAMQYFAIRSVRQLRELSEMCGFTPKCHRISRTAESYHVTLENLTSDYAWPCILDVKMGTTYDAPYLAEEKRQLWQRRAECCTTSTLGIRLTGYRGKHHASGDTLEVGRETGRTMTSREAFKAVVVQFIRLVHPDRRERMVQGFLGEMHKHRKWFERQTTGVFRQASLLFTFDSLYTEDEEDDDVGTTAPQTEEELDADGCGASSSGMQQLTMPAKGQEGPSKGDNFYDLRIIDFTHALAQSVDSTTVDTGFLFGLDNLISIFEDITSDP